MPDQLSDKDISRRAFFFRFADTTLEIAKKSLIIYGAGNLLFLTGRRLTEPSNAELCKKAIDALLGDAGRYQVNLGHRHIRFPVGTVHPDIRLAGEKWRELFPVDSVQSVPNLKTPEIDTSGDILALGSPGSNDISRLSFGLEGQMDDLHPLPAYRRPVYDYVHAKSEVKSLGEIKRYVGGRLLTTPNWKIVNNETGTERIPKVDANGFIERDFLLVSRLPNRLNQDAKTRASEVVVAGGAHGVGLSSFDRTLLSARNVERIRSEIGGAPYFQALFIVEKIKHDSASRETVAHAADLLDVVGYNEDPIQPV